MDDVRGARVDEFAGGLERVAVFLELHAEVGRMRRVLLVFAEVRRGAIEKADGWVVAADQLVGRVLLDPGENAFALGVEHVEGRKFLLRVPDDAEGVGAIFAVGRPITHLLRVEGGLGAGDRGAGHAGGFAGDRVSAVRIGEVIVEGDPKAGAGAGRAARQGDLGLIEVPFLGLAARELEGAGAIDHRSFHGWHEAVVHRVPDVAVFHRNHRDAGVEGGLEHTAYDRSVAAGPTAAVDIEEEGRRLI